MIHSRFLFKRRNLLLSALLVICIIYFSSSLHQQYIQLMTVSSTLTTTDSSLAYTNQKAARVFPLLQKQNKDDYNNNHSASPYHTKEDNDEKYIAYLPHSGLSNQRIELANALLLAYMLNRTLIIPPAFLGNVFGWMQRDQLIDRIDWLTTPKPFTKICQPPTPGLLATYLQRSRCSEYRQFALMNWTELHDFSPLTEEDGQGNKKIKIQFQPIFSMAQIKKDLHITDDDIFLHQDTQLYDWRLYQNKTEAVELLKNKTNYFDSFSGRRYYKVLMPRHFQQRTEKLLFLGGVFGSTRIHLIDPEDLQMQEKIKSVLRYRMDTRIGDTVKRIVDYLGGKSTFMSVHFRTGDNPFKKEIANNLNLFRQNMTELLVQQKEYYEDRRHLLGERQQEDTMLDAFLDEEGEEEDDNTETEKDTVGDDELFRTTAHCLNIASHQYNDPDQASSVYQFDQDTKNRVKVYIATDHKDPRNPTHSQLLPWFRDFPCTTVLKDLPNYLFDPLDTMHDIVVPSKSLRPFLIPIVDAMVAAHGRHVLTTPRSTFSRYIEELHDAWI